MRVFLALALALALLTQGCALPEDAHRLENTDCLDNIWSEIPVNEFFVAYNVGRAREALDRQGIVPADEFCPAFRHQRVLIRDEHLWDCGRGSPEGVCLIGQYDWFYGITVNDDSDSLVHELLHAWDWGHMGLTTGMHDGWIDNGYFRASAWYQRVRIPTTKTQWTLNGLR